MKLDTAVQAILSKVVDSGAEGDLIIDQGQSLSLKAQDGSLEEHKVTSNRILGLRVIRDAKVGTAYSEAIDEDAIHTMVDQALLNASYAGEEPAERLVASEHYLQTDDTLLCPPDTSSVEEKIDFALALESSLATKPKVQSVPYNGVQTGFGQRQIFSTQGLSASTRYANISAYAYALIEEGDVNAMEGSGQASRTFDGLDVDVLVSRVHQAGLDILHGKPVASGSYDVIFDVETQSALFSVFLMMFSGKSAKDGVNPMRDRLGDTIADTRLTLVDDPEDVFGFGYTLFDDEGSQTQQTTLIDAGVLANLAHNSVTASHFATHNTAHATRGPRSTLGVGLHQLKVKAGDASERDCTTGQWLEITDLTGLHSGANPISGEFSFGASGFLHDGPNRVQPVRGITVAGNFYNMLSNISSISDTPMWNWQRSSCLPMIRFANVSVSG